MVLSGCWCMYQSKTIDAIHVGNGCRMVWSYFKFGHGKGVHDGVGAILKQEIIKEQFNMYPKRLQSVFDVVSYCERRQMEKHFVYPNARKQVFHFFHLVKPKDVNRSTLRDCKNIARTNFLHLVASVSHRDVTLLKLINLACFCHECMDDNPYLCENKS